MSESDRDLIPPPPLVRAKLARAVREARRLRSLLRLSEKAELDRQFCDELIHATKSHEGRRIVDGRGVAR
ncbi:hypothetical protein [Tautonia plasticadhaerens]|uniref:Uncharacterized protein n=1 Tax=Tautonia plasticadhaerens TaxID=2527974 RepID=A0A518H0T6_9BACT|nr:hypothetical protein [Tautonia plasticadhaerens]QDV34433.1 hypothetical protein ElP_23210 [Tautonia plasticadhaerens]